MLAIVLEFMCDIHKLRILNILCAVSIIWYVSKMIPYSAKVYGGNIDEWPAIRQGFSICAILLITL